MPMGPINNQRDVEYIGVYESQGMHQEYVGGESNDYQMKIDLSSFNCHLHIKDFLDWVTKI